MYLFMYLNIYFQEQLRAAEEEMKRRAEEEKRARVAEFKEKKRLEKQVWSLEKQV